MMPHWNVRARVALPNEECIVVFNDSESTKYLAQKKDEHFLQKPTLRRKQAYEASGYTFAWELRVFGSHMLPAQVYSVHTQN